MRNAGVEDRVQVHLMDYRNMPPSFEKAFDACISIEMLEVLSKSLRRIHHSSSCLLPGCWRQIYEIISFEDRLGIERQSGGCCFDFYDVPREFLYPIPVRCHSFPLWFRPYSTP